MPSSGADISYGIWGIEAPNVTFGPSAKYTIGYCGISDSVSPTVTGGFAENIDVTTGYPFGFPASIDLYQINTIPGTLIFPTIAATCNAGGHPASQQLLASWMNGSNLYQKSTLAAMVFKPTGVSNELINQQWSIFPNPASEYITLHTSSNNFQNISYLVISVTGKVFMQSAVSKNDQQVQVQDLPDGTYLLQVYEHGKQAASYTFIKM